MNITAPLDLGRLEIEAKTAAVKKVANQLQQPDQLDKVDQIRRNMARKKGSVEAMLKTAVQSQLDGVRTGLQQLHMALQDVYEIKQKLTEVDETYREIQPFVESLKLIREENAMHCQLGAAVENWKHIFTVPEIVRKTKDLISDSRLLQAHKCLQDLEKIRDELLMELHKQSKPSPTDKNTLNQYFGDVQTLSDDLAKQLWLILQRTLISVRREPSVIVTALRIIEREERTDHAYLKQEEVTNFLPQGRPKKWREKCFKVLAESISNRIEANQFEERKDHKMWLVRHLEMIRQFMVEDLLVVKTLLPSAFPPHYDIVNSYVKMYHEALAQHLLDVISCNLEAKELVSLLTWVNSYDGPELLQHPDLQLDTSKLEPLLNKTVLDDLENQYLKNMKNNITEWLRNCLKSDVKDWYNADKPDCDGSGFYHTSFPIIIFQMIEQNIQVGSMIDEALVRKILSLFVQELMLFAADFKAEIKKYQEKHLIDRSEPKYFVYYLMAIVNNCETLSSHLLQQRTRYLKEDVSNSNIMFNSEIRKDRIMSLSEEFTNIGNFGCECLLDELSLDLTESKCFQSLFTKPWIESSQFMDVICETVMDYNKDFTGIKPAFHSSLIDKVQKKIINEYLTAIFSKRLSLKNYEDRVKSAERLVSESYTLKDMFASLQIDGDQKTGEKKKSVFEVLSLISEVLKLKDTSMISLEITTLANKHPDIREEQIISLLLIRGDVNRSEARQIALDVLGEDGLRPRPHGLFSDLAV